MELNGVILPDRSTFATTIGDILKGRQDHLAILRRGHAITRLGGKLFMLERSGVEDRLADAETGAPDARARREHLAKIGSNIADAGVQRNLRQARGFGHAASRVVH